MVMTITEMRELKEQKGYTLEEIAEKSGIDIELSAKIFYKKEQIEQKEFYDLLTYSEIRELEKVFVEADKNKAAEVLGAYQVKKQGEYTLEDYYALPDDQRYEVIDGVLYDMAAPAVTHQEIAFEIAVALRHTGRCIYGAPDMVIEVTSPSTRKKDFGKKLEKYVDAGVREYWIADVKNQKVIVYDLGDDFGENMLYC